MRLRLSFRSLVLGGCLVVVVCTLVLVSVILQNLLKERMLSDFEESLFQQVTVYSSQGQQPERQLLI